VSKILGELAEDIAIDLRSSFGTINGQMDVLCGHHRQRQNRRQET
jgi:hypothetical protein